MGQRCFNCSATIFTEAVSDQDVSGGMYSNDRLEVEWDDDDDFFFRCPHCLAKNIIAEAVDSIGLPVLRVSHIKL
jgi:hypothetical protein